MSINSQRGFTIIEMLMVILLVAILSAVAIPQFLDFRTDAKDAATSASLGAIRTGIANQKGMMTIRCGAAAGAWPSAASVNANDVVTGTDCTALQVPATDDRKLVATSTLPGNPWGPAQSAAVVACTAGGGCDPLDATDCAGNAYGATADGWCYNPATGQIWANSANSAGPAKEHTF